MITKKRPATRADVAREAGTSVAVVSYVVNDGPRPVAMATRRRVLDAIEAVGYSPNSIARALASGVSGAYGLIVPDISNAFFAAMAHKLEDAVAALGTVLLLGDSAESKDRENELVRQFVQRNIDGILYIGVDDDPCVQIALDASVPVVMLDRVDRAKPVSSIAIDNVAAARAATEHLIGHGHTRIGIIAGPPQLSTADDRTTGWRQAMESAGLPIDRAWRYEAPFSRRGGESAASAIFERGHRPDALFASNEQQALGLVHAAAVRGIRIPDDLAVITIDGTDDSEFANPALSTVVQPLEETAKSAFDLLTQPSGTAVHRTCTYTLRLRQSCGAHHSRKETR
ncbi:LacI family DNA-binding transcriptional regulator [Spelaeicoccus albus]|uniref:LacI family transcriptional regulator n=1 Tax=Spelaeicoccus albus TaxID=1280376 RepID=A0A7Z0D1Z0_9MICO|nr:LacI family DNA-binding transcriptional regulator [Spelaeicoccus albus]NYI67210.1 LacI family transcriptional regulator [Spelaeicoccus albus]